MAVKGFCHVAIGVTDLDRSKEFYRDVVGLKVAMEAEERGRENTVHRNAVFLRWDDDVRPGFIVLDFQLNRPPRGKAAEMFDVGFHHIAFSVDDCEATVNRAVRFGSEVWSTPKQFNGPDFGVPAPHRDPVVISAIVTDPDGNHVQFDQWLTD
jgi:catechol 2,3-dioxygenase-like lactoylglutathione lyase family enzyme